MKRGKTPERGRLSRRILIIEDNVEMAESLKEFLELIGHKIAVVHDGHAGIAEARVFLPDIVLCDIGLPDLDGYAVARILRKDDELRNTRLIALSGHALPEDVQRAAEAGFHLHLAKPPDLEKLKVILASIWIAPS
jgi:two-component system, chemotaxis family, CheB/CheR fusion protein